MSNLHRNSSTERSISSAIDVLPISSLPRNVELHNETAKREANGGKVSKRKVADNSPEKKRRRNEALKKFRKKEKEQRKKVKEMIEEKKEEDKRLDVELKSAYLNYNYWKEIKGTSRAEEIKEHLSKFALNLKKNRK